MGEPPPQFIKRRNTGKSEIGARDRVPFQTIRIPIRFKYRFFDLTPCCRIKTDIETTHTFFLLDADTAWIG
jgi:hypothetical protein